MFTHLLIKLILKGSMSRSALHARTWAFGGNFTSHIFLKRLLLDIIMKYVISWPHKKTVVFFYPYAYRLNLIQTSIISLVYTPNQTRIFSIVNSKLILYQTIIWLPLLIYHDRVHPRKLDSILESPSQLFSQNLNMLVWTKLTECHLIKLDIIVSFTTHLIYISPPIWLVINRTPFFFIFMYIIFRY